MSVCLISVCSSISLFNCTQMNMQNISELFKVTTHIHHQAHNPVICWIQNRPPKPLIITIPCVSPSIQFTWRSEWKRVSKFVQLLSVHRLYTYCCNAMWDWLSALNNVRYGFGHHYKWLSHRIMPYLGAFWILPFSFTWPQPVVSSLLDNSTYLLCLKA